MNRFRTLFVTILVAGLGLRLFVLFWNDLDHLGGHVEEWFLVDDSYYCLEIARNIAHGEGWTHDGRHETNGFQPLYVFAIVPFYALVDADDRVTPLYAALLLLALLNLGAAAWLGLFVRRLTDADGLALFAAAAFALSPNLIGVGVNGMETSLALFLAGAALYAWLGERRRGLPLRWGFVLGMGGLLGVGLWARLDLALLALALGLDMTLTLVRERRFAELLAKGAALTALTVLLYAPFMVLGHARSGSALPESGPAVRQLSLIRQVGPEQRLPVYLAENLKEALAVSALGAPLLPDDRLLVRSDGDYVMTVATTLLVNGPLLLLYLLVVSRGVRRHPEESRRLWLGLRPAVLYATLLAFAYALYVFGDHYFYRYLYPAVWVTVAGLLAGLTLLPRPTRRVVAGLFGVFFVMNFAVELHPTLAADAPNQWGRFQLAAMERLDLAAGEPVGAFQSGYFSYWNESDRAIVNLDGVVNRDAFAALRDRRLPAYVRDEGIRYVIDWGNTRALLTHGGFPLPELRTAVVVHGIHALRLPTASTSDGSGPAAAR